jgi:uncharacterized protein YfaP (DUF2135 family)
MAHSKLILSGLLLASLLGSAAASPKNKKRKAHPKDAVATAAGAPVIRILHPVDGWTTERKITVDGTISDPKIARTTLSLNGTAFLIKAEGGHFHQKVVVSEGLNTVVVETENEKGRGRAVSSFFARVPKVDLKVYLMFDPQPFYIDLWITEPDGEKNFWANRETKSGGVLHDLYNDLPGGGVGMGPQAYTVANAPAGKYKIQVNYWAGGVFGEGEVAEGPYGARAQPMVPIRVETVLYEGTPQEERRSFDAVLSKPSDTYTVGEIEVLPPVERGHAPVRFLSVEKVEKRTFRKKYQAPAQGASTEPVEGGD